MDFYFLLLFFHHSLTFLLLNSLNYTFYYIKNQIIIETKNKKLKKLLIYLHLNQI